MPARGRVILPGGRRPLVEAGLEGVVTDERMRLFSEMEAEYEGRNAAYFVGLLSHEDYAVRTRATCVLVDLGGEDKIEHIARVLRDDPNELVRHEAAFSLGQMGYSACVPHLERATLGDPSMFVRHEAAIALGVVGNKGAREALTRALSDPDVPVVESAVVALSNIEFMEKLSKNEKFARLTGG